MKHTWSVFKKVAAFALIGLAIGTALSAQGKGAFAGINLKGVTVTFWHVNTTIREEGLKKMIDAFNASNTYGIVVKEEYAGGYGDVYNKMLAGIQAGQVPELVVAYQNNAAAYQSAGALVDINPYMDDPVYGLSAADKKDFIAGILAQDVNSQFNNQRLGLAPNRSAEVLYYNADMLKSIGYSAPPKTWDEFAGMAKKATSAANGTYGYAIGTDASTLFSQTIGRGGDYYSADKKGFDFTKKSIEDSLTFMKALLDSGAGHKIAEQYGDQTDFGNGKVLFTIGSSSGIPFYDQAVQKGAKGPFKWSVAPLPHTTAKAAINMYGASVSITKTTPEKQLASWIFLKWFTDAAQQKTWTEISNYFPTRASVRAGLGDYLKKNPIFDAALSALLSSDIVTEPPFASYEAVRQEVTKTYNAILDGAPIKAALQTLNATAAKINADSMK